MMCHPHRCLPEGTPAGQGCDSVKVEGGKGKTDPRGEGGFLNGKGRLTSTSPSMRPPVRGSGKDRHPSLKTSVLFPMEIIRGLHRMYSCPEALSPSGLNTISWTLTPTCGAARPTPSSLYMTSNISVASFFRSLPNSAMRPQGARSLGSGYSTIESTVRGEFHSSLVTEQRPARRCQAQCSERRECQRRFTLRGRGGSFCSSCHRHVGRREKTGVQC